MYDNHSNHTLFVFFNYRPEIQHPSTFTKYRILYQVVWNTVQLIHAAVTWILNKQSWLMNVPCSTKINNHHIPHWTFRNFTRQRLQFICHEFNARMKNEWNKNWMKQKLNETYCWYSIGLHAGWNIFLNKQCKTKITYSRPVLFSFPAWQETELMDAFKCWAKYILFWSVM